MRIPPLFALAVIVAILAVAAAATSGGLESPAGEFTRALLPNGNPADVQMSDAITLAAYYDKTAVLQPSQPLPPYSRPLMASVQVTKLGSLGAAATNPNRKYTIRFSKRNGNAFQFTGPTQLEIPRAAFFPSGRYGAGLVPGACGTSSTLVAQLVFQNKNPSANTFGQEYVLKEATRTVTVEPCKAS